MAMPCCGDIADALAELERVETNGGNAVPRNVPINICEGNLAYGDKDDDCWANCCCFDQIAMPFVALKLGVKRKSKALRQVSFDDKLDVVTFAIDDCLFQKQTPPTSFLTCDTVGREISVDDVNIKYHSAYSQAVARFKALDLLSAWAIDGRKVHPLAPNSGEDDLSCEFVTSNVQEQSCDMPRRVLFWEDDRVLSFVPDRDGYASYGRPEAYWVREVIHTIEEATIMSKRRSRSWEHYGKVPPWACLPICDPIRKVIRHINREVILLLLLRRLRLATRHLGKLFVWKLRLGRLWTEECLSLSGMLLPPRRV
jgi:hypothetical protein